jgi:hypothetical protein
VEIYLSLLFAVIGLVVFLIAKTPDYKEVGRLTFFAGLLAFLLGPAIGRMLSVIQR